MPNFQYKALCLSMSTILVLKVVGASPVVAAEETKQDFALEEVVVTARRKSEDLQSVPDTVAVLSGDTVARANISAARDVTSRMPNVSIVESLSPSSTFIIVRGISSCPPRPGRERLVPRVL